MNRELRFGAVLWRHFLNEDYTRRFLPYASSVLIIYAAIVMGAATVGSIQSDRAEAVMESWALSINTAVPSLGNIDLVDRQMEHAFKLMPNNPVAVDRVAQLHVWRITSTPLEQRDNREINLSVMPLVRLSVGLLPGWASSWAKLFMWKTMLGEYDEELITALRRSSELGMWAPEINYAILSSGLPVWESLNDECRSFVFQAGLRSIVQNPIASVRLLRAYDQLESFCKVIRNTDQTLSYCNGSK